LDQERFSFEMAAVTGIPRVGRGQAGEIFRVGTPDATLERSFAIFATRRVSAVMDRRYKEP
jgi:hypothetical protein